MITVGSSDIESKKRERTTTRTVSFKKTVDQMNEINDEEPVRSVMRKKVGKVLMINTTANNSFNKEVVEENGDSAGAKERNRKILLANSEKWFSPKPENELNAAATKVQKVYKSYRTRRNLADCAVVVEELWWKALDSAALRRCSVSFFDSDESETAISKWARAMTRAAKVGKGLSKNEKAQKLALRHWLEAIDPRHRYGHNLHMYYAVWFDSESFQPFFYWLDIGDGKEVNLETCPRTDLHFQCIKYLGPKEREAYEVIVVNGKLLYKQSGVHVATPEGTKWIFVLSTTKKLYVGEKKKGLFQHSSFLAGGATITAGRLVAHNGDLQGIWPYSGHYCPKEENFMEFISFLEEHHVDLANVKKCPMDDDVPPSYKTLNSKSLSGNSLGVGPSSIAEATNQNGHPELKDSPKHRETKVELPKPKPGRSLSFKWTTGAGPRISCMREYPSKLQFQALEHVNLSPRVRPNSNPIASPRPSPKVHLSPRLSYLGLPSPRLYAFPKN